MKALRSSRRPVLIVGLLLAAAFGLSASIEPWFQGWAGSRTDSANLLAVALGDSRRLLARHVYAKADAYFHNGYYPSIFDYQTNLQGDAMSERIGLEASAGDHCEESYLGPPRDWIDRFSRHFYPSRHTHLGQDLGAEAGHDCGEDCLHDHEPHVHGPDCDHGEPHHDDHNHSSHGHGALDEPHEGTTVSGHAGHAPHLAAPPPSGPDRDAGLEREILPWLRFSASLNPNRVETYVVAAYWLRTELQRPLEAEQFLREGLRANPGNPEILFELGRIYRENRKEPARARNVWELAARRWRDRQAETDEPNIFLYAQILGNLGRLEEEQGNWARAIEHLKRLREISPYRDSIEQWIAELQSRAAKG